MTGIQTYWRALFVDSWGRTRLLTEWTSYGYANDVALSHGASALVQRLFDGQMWRPSW